ncbi:MAG TPA: hypothetical protein DCX46_11075, partial [Bacteroidetes bacterium]|nr:hypothetical protein [Bacteroidota bacterium]
LFNGLHQIPGISILSPVNEAERSAMITFRHEKLQFPELQRHLSTYELRTRAVSEGGVNALRVSTHIYNNFEELDRVLEGTRTATTK